MSNINITKKKGFGCFNLAAYWKRKYNKKSEKEPWYLLTNLDNLEEVIEIYRSRMGIEAMFKDCKTGGYNLEGSRANPQRLTNLILLRFLFIIKNFLTLVILRNFCLPD